MQKYKKSLSKYNIKLHAMYIVKNISIFWLSLYFSITLFFFTKTKEHEKNTILNTNGFYNIIILCM